MSLKTYMLSTNNSRPLSYIYIYRSTLDTNILYFQTTKERN